jgi:aminobenzoyl-glutamate utilization protein B
MPEWSADEEDLARRLQERAKVKVEGLKQQPTLMKGEAQQKSSANDSGDVSWKVPTAKFYFPSNIPNIANHHWAAGVALATSIAHKGGVAGAKAMSAAIVECLGNPALVDEAKRTFKEEIADTPYKPLLPVNQAPPLSLNRTTQDKYRPLLAEHYVKERPEFV